jgi:prepilin-type N-terminal cleavage/methylation domain-containing protein
MINDHWPGHRAWRLSGFSLLEVIIATAILAASSMVLLSLLGLGTKYGNRAEERSLIASQAQSLLDEYIVSASADAIDGQTDSNDRQERTGKLPGLPTHRYRLVASPFMPATLRASNSAIGQGASTTVGSPAARRSNGLTLLHIQVFESGAENVEAIPMLEFSQIVRNGLLVAPSTPVGSPVRDPFQLSD